ncbi:MAG: hisA/hisF family protein [Planctomycetia bacterium]|nr:hisA/hisF family protein [Planctomycetia bacterium]
MQIIPVLDLLEGVVVRGVAGKRSEYRPVISRLTPRADALSVARAFRDQLGLMRLYVADLDAIVHRRPNLRIVRALADAGFELLVDAGIRDASDSEAVIQAGTAKVIAGLETCPGPDSLSGLTARYGAPRVIFSLDLKDGKPVGNLERWETTDAFEIACRAIQCGVTQVIVLDVAQVGVGAGLTTEALCRRLIHGFPGLVVITGGGIRDAADLQHIRESGVHGVLIASALHDGRIGKSDIAHVAWEGG